MGIDLPNLLCLSIAGCLWRNVSAMVMHSTLSIQVKKRMRDELQECLAARKFDYHVTLATNSDGTRRASMRSLLKRWDARTNRSLLQGNWLDKPDERMMWWAFQEKADTNPHWHLLVNLDDANPFAPSQARQDRFDRFAEIAEVNWKKVISSGTANVSRVVDRGIIDYCLKELGLDERWEEFIVAREFVPH